MMSCFHVFTGLNIRYRRRIANGSLLELGIPAATNMREVTWDEELASIAELWASQCASIIDPVRIALIDGAQVNVSPSHSRIHLKIWVLVYPSTIKQCVATVMSISVYL